MDYLHRSVPPASFPLMLALLWWTSVVVSCTHPAPGGGQDGPEAFDAGLDAGSTDAGVDASDICSATTCTSELVLDPVVFGLPSWPQPLDCAGANIDEMRFLVVQNGTLVLDQTTKCGGAVVLRPLPSGPVNVAGLAYNWTGFGTGISILIDFADAGIRAPCDCAGYPFCDGVSVELPPDATTTMPIRLDCSGCLLPYDVTDACGL